MKHLFLNKELSLLAKEKGFDEPCLALWRRADSKLILPNVSYSKFGINKQHDRIFFNDNGEDEIGIYAPLYQQIIDWFREKHNIVISVLYWPEVGNSVYTYDIYQNDQFNGGNGKEFKQFYDAQNKAIQEAFKLI